MMDIENPMTRWKEEEIKLIGVDELGNNLWTGDTVLKIDDKVYRRDDLTFDTVQVLKQLGAEELILK